MQLSVKGQCMVTGYLGKDPETKEPNGKRLVELSIIESKDRPKEGQQYGDTHWANVTVWGGYQIGEQLCDIAESLEKNDQVCVIGKLQVSTYTAKDGTQRESKRLNADFIIPLKYLLSGGMGVVSGTPTDKFQDVADDDEGELPF